MMNKEKTSLILHGHFYQPPRENPRTGIIPLQNTAAPWKNWNEKIFNECYGTNLHSRYLSPYGRIVSLTNNFSYISYNFGPTLLKWIEEKHFEDLELIYESDRASLKRLGHGNALAQSYNHTILPLDKPEDAKTQVIWGIENFQYHFKRDPEGMWLPEAAINSNVIDILKESGIGFVILSPWQAKGYYDKDENYMALGGMPIAYDRPFFIQSEKGNRIAAFFYNHKLAEGISFGHLLHSADGLYDTLLKIRETDDVGLLHAATDGEIYGHHEPYGDMALAALIRKVEERDDFEFTNYATYLEKHPPKETAVLHQGEEGKGSSWSCAHGVSRWYKDCGCHTGGEEGWNQAWRTPLRRSFSNLKNKMDLIFSIEVNKIFKGQIDSETLIRKAGCTFSGTSMRSFIEGLHQEYEFEAFHDIEIAHLVTGMKNIHFSFTSCGFFFADLSGIEARQNIQYAIHAIRLYQPFYEDDLLLPFLADLRYANSNIKGIGDGMLIAQEEMKGLSGETEAALAFYLNRNFAYEQDYILGYGKFSLENYYMDESRNRVIHIFDNETLDNFYFTVLSTSTVDNGINLYFSVADSTSSRRKHMRITNKDIPPRLLSKCFKWIDSSMNRITYNEIDDMSNSMYHYSLLVKNSKYKSIATDVVENIGVALKIVKSFLAIQIRSVTEMSYRTKLDTLLDFIIKTGRAEEVTAVKDLLSSYSNKVGRKITKEGLTEDNAILIFEILGLARRHGFEPTTTKLQNEVYPFYAGIKKYEISTEKARKVFDALNFQ